MKVTIEVEGNPGEVAALLDEIAGRHVSSGYSIGYINHDADDVAEKAILNLLESLEKRARA